MKNERKDWCKLPYALLLDERLTPADAVVYAVLNDILQGGRNDVQIAGIAELTGLSPRQIHYSLQKLKEAGYIVSARSTGRKLVLEIERVVSEPEPKKRKPEEQSPEENQEHVEEALRNVLAKKMNGKSEKAVAETYEEMKAQASARVTDKSKTLAYLSKMISSYQDKPDNSDGFDADEYECFLNQF